MDKWSESYVNWMVLKFDDIDPEDMNNQVRTILILKY